MISGRVEAALDRVLEAEKAYRKAQDHANKMKGELENARRNLRETKEREDSGQLEIFPEN